MKKFIILLSVILLTNAVFASDLPKTEKYYKSQIISQNCPYNTVGLIYSIQKKKPELTEYFMLSGFDPNAVYVGFPATFYAVKVNDTESLEILLKHGAYPDAVTMGGTLLIWAIENKNPEAVKIIIKYGADVNKDYMDTIPLNQAIKTKNAEIVKTLLNAGASANEKTNKLVEKSKVQDIKDLFSAITK